MSNRGMHLPRRSLAVASLAIAFILAAGCGGPAQKSTHPVEGKVVAKGGGSLAGGKVHFESAASDPKERVNAQGEIQSDGSFRLTTYKSNDGAVEGTHKAIVIPPMKYEPEQKGKPKTPLPPAIAKKYLSYETSGLEYKVNPGPNKIEITVEK